MDEERVVSKRVLRRGRAHVLLKPHGNLSDLISLTSFILEQVTGTKERDYVC